MIVDAHLHVWRAMLDYPDPASTVVSAASDVPIIIDHMAHPDVSAGIRGLQPLLDLAQYPQVYV